MITRTQRFKPDVAQIVTDQILEALERGVVPWKKPWRSELPMNLVTKHQYHGINLLLLSLQPYASPYYLTFNQVSDLGGQVKAGSKGSRIIYWRILEHLSPEGEITTIPLMRYYVVFNLEQCFNIPGEKIPSPGETIDPIRECEVVLAGMPNKPGVIPATEAYYERTKDVVGIPPMDRFTCAEEYYSTLFHELVHSTGHHKRLNRDNKYSTLGFNEAYSNEELIAEIGSSFLCANTGIAPRTIANQTSYISYWLARLESDKRLIISAAAAAQKASDYILHLPGEINFNQCTWLGDYYAN